MLEHNAWIKEGIKDYLPNEKKEIQELLDQHW